LNKVQINDQETKNITSFASVRTDIVILFLK